MLKCQSNIGRKACARWNATLVDEYQVAAFYPDVIIRQRVDALAPPDDRLQRMIQYAAAHRLNLIAAECWMPAFAGMTTVFFDGKVLCVKMRRPLSLSPCRA